MTSSKIVIRQAEARDEQHWRALWQSYCDFYEVSIAPHVTDVTWARIMDQTAPVHAIVAENVTQSLPEIIGFANYVLHFYTWGTESVCYLEDLFVRDTARGLGAGRTLIEHLIELSRQNGWPRLYWNTHQNNEQARALYDKFTPVDPFVRYVVKLGV